MSDIYGEQYLSYLSQRSPIRRFVRQFYLRSAASYFRRPTVDIGCGIGSLLERLPRGSFGLEVNEAAVKYCQSKGLDVRLFDPSTPMSQVLTDNAEGKSYDFVCSHVLEHLPSPQATLTEILEGANAIEARTGVIIVPGAAGFRSDKTHVTFLDAALFAEWLAPRADWSISQMGYYPFSSDFVSAIFPHNELRVLIERKA